MVKRGAAGRVSAHGLDSPGAGSDPHNQCGLILWDATARGFLPLARDWWFFFPLWLGSLWLLLWFLSWLPDVNGSLTSAAP